ncbi:MAG: hypothetical protein OHK0038_21590 [Flammeovirgaceae bacterium]
MGFTFTGANIPPEVKTFSIENFGNDASMGPANLELRFTEDLRSYFQKNTSLKLINETGDYQFAGKILKYEVSPVAAGAGALQSAELNRLTITIELQFTNNFDNKKSFKQTFSNYRDFPASQNVQDVEAELIPQIFEQIIFEIFNKTVADW